MAKKAKNSEAETPRRFRVYYGDGSTYSGDPFQAPPANVQAIAYEEPNAQAGFLVVQGKDCYVWRYGLWDGVDIGGLWDYLLIGTGPKYVLCGRSIRDEDFWATVTRAGKEGLGE